MKSRAKYIDTINQQLSLTRRTLGGSVEGPHEQETIVASSSAATLDPKNPTVSSPAIAGNSKRLEGHRRSSIFDQLSTNDCNSARNLGDFYDKNEQTVADLKQSLRHYKQPIKNTRRILARGRC